MPLFALALNFSWEVVYALFVAESTVEKSVFTLWLVMDCGMVYGMIKYAKYEWTHSPKVAYNIGSVFTVMVVGATLGQWMFAKWWIENEIGKRDGKFYQGIVGPDTTELGFWSAILCQSHLSVASLCQLLIRQHSGGVNWTIWWASTDLLGQDSADSKLRGTRALGSVIGLYLVYGWAWYFWREAHQYFMSPFAIFLWATSLICDGVYPYALWCIKKTENVLPDGRKIGKHHVNSQNGKRPGYNFGYI